MHGIEPESQGDKQEIPPSPRIENLPTDNTTTVPHSRPISTQKANRQSKKTLMNWFYNQSISRKQLIALVASELVTVLGFGIGGTLIIIQGLRAQLLEQAKSEVAVTEINYNIKVNQMGFGFRGQSDNSAIIQAATNHANKQALTPALRADVKQILQNEVTARQIEYATLVGADSRIIVNANNDRTGEIFNPNNLVNEVIKNSQQIKVNAVVNWAEISKEKPPLPPGFNQQDALIRYTATPVKLRGSNNVIGVLISGDVVNGKDAIVKNTLQATGGGYSAVYMRKSTGEFALVTALDGNQGTQNLDLPDKSLLAQVVGKSPGKAHSTRMIIGTQTYTLAAKSIPNKIIETATGSVPDLKGEPVAILVRGTPETALNNLLMQSLLEQSLFLGLGLILIAVWAVILRRGIIKPILKLEQTTQKFATGDHTARAVDYYDDEVGKLATTFNQMADSITAQAGRQETAVKQAQLINEITYFVRETLNCNQILSAAVSQTRTAINTDRVSICCYGENWQSQIIHESVSDDLASILGSKIANSELAQAQLDKYQQGEITVLHNIDSVDVNLHYLSYDAKAVLIAPIFTNKKLYGLLIAHQYHLPRQWQELEINVLKQVAIQVGFALEQAQLLAEVEHARQVAENISEQRRHQQQALQRQLMELLENIESAASGDLTVRSHVTEGEIGTVADFFNSIVESLRALVTQVKASAVQVNTAIGANQGAICELADTALQQAADINRTLERVEQMTLSLQAVADNAQQAATFAHQASVTVQESGLAMDMSMQNILALRETAWETAKQVKRLGESSQEISRVVSLINQISIKTNLLAINAGLEATRAGQQAQGFAIVAEEVSELAARSAAATEEISQIVGNIQQQTSEVVTAIELGTTQVVEGTQMVEYAKQSLSQIVAVSQQIDTLVQSISDATVSQVETSQAVTSLMQEIAQVSERTSTFSHQVSTALQQTAEISQELQVTVGTFKL